MRHKIWIGMLTGLAVFLLVLLRVSRPPRMHIVDAQPAPSAQLAAVGAGSEIGPAAVEAATATPTPTPTSIFEGFTGWRGEYFDNPNLSGNPVLVRDDANIHFHWQRSPATGLPADNFSVRWQRIVTFNNDRIYRFNLQKNDGARVWFDERLIFDLWDDDNDSHAYYVELPVTAGRHTIRVEYREDDASAVIRFWWQDRGASPTATPTPTPTPTPTSTPTAEPPLEDFTGWRGKYYNNSSFRGEPALVRDDPNIDFNWGSGSPAAGVPADKFSVRWERIVSFDAGRYKFSVQKDDGARVWVDGRLIIDRWSPQTYGPTHSAEVTLAAGAHTIRVDYYERSTDARINFWWEQLSTPTPTPFATRPLEKNSWRAEFFANQLLAGIPAGNEIYRSGYGYSTSGSFSLNWGSGGPKSTGGNPIPGIPDDHFSARLGRIVTLDGGLYRFTLEKDDGARVWVDDRLIIDHWKDCCEEGVRFEAEVSLIAGVHTIRVEYYEKEGSAKLSLGWARIGPLSMPTATPTPWTATMTVGSGGGYAGYGLSAGGTLSDADFSWRGTTYTLEAILHNAFAGSVSIDLSDAIDTGAEELTLCLGALQLDFADAFGPDNRQFFWDNVDPGWSDGETVAVTVGVHGCGG